MIVYAVYFVLNFKDKFYAKRALRDRKIPFEIIAPRAPFYSKENMECIKESKQQIVEGKIVQKTMEELEAMENE